MGVRGGWRITRSKFAKRASLNEKRIYSKCTRTLHLFLPEGDKERFQEQFALEKSQRKTNPFSSLRKRRVACL